MAVCCDDDIHFYNLERDTLGVTASAVTTRSVGRK